MKIHANNLPLRVTGAMLLAIVIGCAGRESLGEASAAGEDTATAAATPSGADSGIYGWMVSALGNAPAHAPTYQCVKILDSIGQNVVAKGTCSGIWGQFRIPLPPGRYIMESGGSWETVNGAVRFRPNRREVVIKPGEWVKIAPPKLPGPVP